jgi:hypothetical protein
VGDLVDPPLLRLKLQPDDQIIFAAHLLRHWCCQTIPIASLTARHRNLNLIFWRPLGLALLS